jgi:ribosome-binding factor A
MCKQVQRTLSYVLGDCHDAVLRDLFVERVEPAPDSTHLLVSVSVLGGAHPPLRVLEHLHLHHGRLRSEVATAINRKKAPELSFQCIEPPPAPEPTERLQTESVLEEEVGDETDDDDVE